MGRRFLPRWSRRCAWSSRSSDGPLNLLLTDGRTIAATALGNSLFTTDRCGAVVVASEPLDDDPSWKPVADDSLVVADGDGVDISPLA